jgi:hypothetical protein
MRKPWEPDWGKRPTGNYFYRIRFNRRWQCTCRTYEHDVISFWSECHNCMGYGTPPIPEDDVYEYEN